MYVGGQGSTDGTGAFARFFGPFGSLFDGSTSPLYLCDMNNTRIRAVTTPGAVVTTWAGTSSGHTDGTGTTSVQFNFPGDAAYDATNAAMFITDLINYPNPQSDGARSRGDVAARQRLE